MNNQGSFKELKSLKTKLHIKGSTIVLEDL